jgi:hypothetical protein
MEREALKLALEALESGEKMQYGRVGWIEYDSFLVKEAITAIKEALAQPADNPYGYDWSMLEAAQESLREHMARIKELEAQLAQPAQEPVACVMGTYGGMFVVGPLNPAIVLPVGMALYSTPQHTATWVGLTPEETSGFTSHEMTVVKYVSKVLQEKNT